MWVNHFRILSLGIQAQGLGNQLFKTIEPRYLGSESRVSQGLGNKTENHSRYFTRGESKEYRGLLQMLED